MINSAPPAVTSGPHAQLLELYRSAWPALVDSLKAYPQLKEVSFPLLIHLDSTNYLSAARKLLCVGQQTFGWGGDGREVLSPEAFNRCLEDYRNFALGTNYTASPFWAACRKLYHSLNPDGPRNGYAWSNLIRVDQAGYRPSPEIENAVRTSFNVLGEEIAILKPDVVVFLTGPTYDQALEETFPKLSFSALENVSIREIARLRHPHLPIASYRVYHPNYLRRSKRWGLLDLIVDSSKA